MVSPDIPVLPPTQMTIGCVLLGVCVALLFYGILLCQGYWYFRTYAEDPAHLKLTVGGTSRANDGRVLRKLIQHRHPQVAAILLANAVNVGLAMHTWSDFRFHHSSRQSDAN
ncbi:hypothetical protein GSI_00097 [Ganoderma sinense ZZ0214-1]|uniref:Uncharacterized protein n=1 Tax=Ganoderma sinense ZZ0214-1 TaxID=1077348 RepID=A0A2G8SRL5_9APHY|nr:hypothetical protein GSI_00097 [Ganoderma sinense ZZ0214-1]